MEVFSELISQIGFPIAVTAFLLIRVEKKLDELNKTLMDMTEIFSQNQ